MDTRLYGTLEGWPSKSEMASLLKSAGLTVDEGEYSIRLKDCEHFVIQEYGGDLGDPQIDAAASTLVRMLRDGHRISATLASADIRHRFELYNDAGELVGYLHHRWPQESRDH